MSKALNILIVEDNPDDQKLCKRALKRAYKDVCALEVTCVDHGGQCLNILQSYTPDCVFLDYHLPGIDGLNLLEKIKSVYPKLPVIILTNQGSEAIAARSIKLGAADYLSKQDLFKANIKSIVSEAQEESTLRHAFSNKSLKIILAEEDSDERYKIDRMIKANNPLYECTNITDADTLLSEVELQDWDVLFISDTFSGGDFFTLVARIIHEQPFLPIIMLTRQGCERVAVRALKTGVFEYIVKGDITTALLNDLMSSALRHKVLERRVYEKDTQIKMQRRQLIKRKELLEKNIREWKASNKMLEEFSNIVSHDLKAPLRHIRHYVHFIQNAYAEEDFQGARGYLGNLERITKKLEDLVDDLVTFSRFSRAKQKMEDVPLNDVINEVRELLQAPLSEKKVQLSVKDLPTVKGNHSLLVHLFMNLISNACKYNEAEHPKIEIWCERSEKGVFIHTRDNGIGFDSRKKEIIFRPFHRLATDKEYEGTGIGLAICHTIAQQHNGMMKAESQEGKGSIFTLKLPSVRRRK